MNAPTYSQKLLEGVQPAPQWLKDQMRRLRSLPPPSLEKVRACFEASANYMNVRYGKFRWQDRGLDEQTRRTHVIR